MTLLDMEIFAEKQGIGVCDVPLREARAISIPGGWIAMDSAKLETGAERLVVLAHECGHFGCGAFYTYDTPELLKRHFENDADRWSYRKLIPLSSLKSAFARGIVEAHELADHFNVTEAFFRDAFRYYRDVRGEI